MFHHCPLLRPHLETKSISEIIETFTQYKIRVPVCGAIILNADMDKVILVKGWSSRAGWGFPKGKINQDEKEIDCAAREVWEETGFDCSGYLNENDFLEVLIREQRTRLYIAHSVPEDYKFSPRTRKEISKIEWIPIVSLPTSFHTTPLPPGGGSLIRPNSFWMVVPFVNKLKKWIANNRKRIEKERKQRAKGNSSKKSTRENISTPSNVPPLLLNKLSHAVRQFDEQQKQETSTLSSQVPPPMPSPTLVHHWASSTRGDPWTDFHFDRQLILQTLQSNLKSR